MSSPELDALLIRNLADIEAAMERIDELDDKVFTEIGHIAEEWTEHVGWIGEYNYTGKEGLWLAPPSWCKSIEDDDAIAWFEFETDEYNDKDTYYSYLAYLCRIGSLKNGFYLKQNFTSQKNWKKLLKDHMDIVSTTPFILDSQGYPFIPVTLSVEELARALREESIADALHPFRTALNQLAASQRAFDKLRAAARR